MYKLISRWAKDTNGATAIEYGLIAAGISVTIAAIIFTMGDEILNMFTTIQDALTSQ